jgi:hypothetical protein
LLSGPPGRWPGDCEAGSLNVLVQQESPFWVDVLSYKGIYSMISIFADFTNRFQLFVAGGG